MPHVLIKLWPGKTDAQKQNLADKITEDIRETLGNGADSVSISFEEVEPAEWAEKVYRPDILGQPERLFKKPGYTM